MARLTLVRRLQSAQRILCGTALLLALLAAASGYADGDQPWQPELLRTRIAEVGSLAPLMFIAIVALRPILFLPSWVAHASGGLLFGTVAGTVWGTVGTSIGAVIAFGMARSLGRDVLARRESLTFMRLDRFLQEHGCGWLAATTALPFTPLTPIYCAAGLSTMHLGRFILAAIAGLLPRVALFSFLGALSVEPTLPHLVAASALLLLGILFTLLLHNVRSTAWGRPTDRADRELFRARAGRSRLRRRHRP